MTFYEMRSIKAHHADEVNIYYHHHHSVDEFFIWRTWTNERQKGALKFACIVIDGAISVRDGCLCLLNGMCLTCDEMLLSEKNSVWCLYRCMFFMCTLLSALRQ